MDDTTRDEFDSWVDQWDKAQNTAAFKAKPTGRPKGERTNFFGFHDAAVESDNITDFDTEYWQNMSSGNNSLVDLGNGEEILTETKKPVKKRLVETKVDVKKRLVEAKSKAEKKANNMEPADTVVPKPPKRSKETLKDTAEAIAKSPNPIYASSRGKDQLPHVTPNWTDGDELVELHNMKINLEQLESKLNAAASMGQETKANKMQLQIDELWLKIDDLSNSLAPDFVNDYLS